MPWNDKFRQFTEWAGMQIGNFFGRFGEKTTPAGVIKKEFGVYPASSQLMESNANLWWLMYVNKSPWKTCDIRPLGIPGAIGRELARYAFTEFNVTVSGGARADYLNRQIKTAYHNFSKYLELGLCLGGVALKPYQDGDRILVDDSTTNFTPTHFDGTGKVIGGVFRTAPVRQGDMYFVRMEYHNFENTDDGSTVYVIRNKAFRSDQSGGIGTEVSLDSVPEWAELEPEKRIEGLTSPLFAYFKPPKANDVEPESKLGISVYAGATVDLIRQADEQWRLIRWEYDSGKRRVYVDGVNAEQFDDEIFLVGPFFNQSGDGRLFEVFSPGFRDDPLYNGFQHILKQIEFNVGLAYGTISDPQTVDKTATEVLSSKHRQRVTEGEIQRVFQSVLDDLLYAMDAICSLAKLAPAGEYKAEYNWGDGVLDDPDTMRQDKAMDASLVREKLMSRTAFVMKWDKVDEETARKMLAEIDSETEEVEPVMEYSE